MALRCPDGADFTVASLAGKRRPGREALTKAMRNLVAAIILRYPQISHATLTLDEILVATRKAAA